MALAGEVCCHWSPGSGRRLPLGTSPACGRERRGGPSWPPGSGLTVTAVFWVLGPPESHCNFLLSNRKTVCLFFFLVINIPSGDTLRLYKYQFHVLAFASLAISWLIIIKMDDKW